MDLHDPYLLNFVYFEHWYLTLCYSIQETYLVEGSTSMKSVMKLDRPLTTTLEKNAFTITGGAPCANSIDSIFIGSVGGRPNLEIPVLIIGLKSSKVCKLMF